MSYNKPTVLLQIVYKMDPDDQFPVSCTSLQKISYGLGHVFNDLCAAMWFSYTLFYFQVVLQMESSTAGLLLMIGMLYVILR